MKKIIALLLIISTLGVILCSCENLGGLNYSKVLTGDGWGVSVSVGNARNKAEIEIPAKYKQYPVYEVSEFSNCTKLVSIKISEGVEIIANSAFYKCKNLKNVVLPNSLCVINDYAFADCENLEKINISEMVYEIGNEVFEGCKKLTEITVSPNNKYYTSIDGVLYSKNKNILVCVGGGVSGTFVIPDGAKEIQEYAFSECTNIEKIVIPESVTVISRSAFYGCTSLSTVNIPNGVEFIYYDMFSGCTSLTNVTIGRSVKLICSDAFLNCVSLSSITYNGTKAQWNAINKDDWNNNTGNYIVHCIDGDIKK